MIFSPGGTEEYFRELAAVMSLRGTGEHTLAELADRHGIDLLEDY